MKIKLTTTPFRRWKWLLKFIMRTFILLLCSTAFGFTSGDIFSQNTKIHIDKDEVVSVDAIFDMIRNQTEYSFIYPEDLFKDLPKIHLKKGTVRANKLLETCFSGRDFILKIEGNKIVIIEADNPKMAQQEAIVSGTVIDTNGQPLPGASIVEKGTTNGTQSDFDGNYKLDVLNENAVLIVSYIGFTSKEIGVNGQAILNISLEESASGLDEVVVVGYGTQKKINLTGSISTLTGETLNKRVVTNTSSMLQGLLPGVQVIQANGQPQEGGVEIQIRGRGTFSNAGSSPLVLIDGVPGSLSAVNPKSIESISVLKDASSAAIYGSRAANGVILITTKSGKGDGKITVEYDYNYGVNSPTKLVDLVTNSSDYMRGWNTDVINKNYGSPVPAKMYPEAEIAKYENPLDPNLYPSFDWQDFMINSSPTVTHNISISGGGEKNHYNLSAGHVDEKGTMEAFRYRRSDVQLNLVSNVNDKLKVGATIALKTSTTNSERTGQSNYYLTVLAQAPTRKPLTVDGEYYSWRAYEYEFNNWNPYLKLKEEFRTNVNYTTSAQLWSDLEVVKGLRWNVKGAVRYDANKQTDLIPNDLSERLYRDSSVEGYKLSSFIDKINTDNLFVNLYSTLNYEKSFNDHNLTALAGYSQEENDWELIRAYRKGLPSPLLSDLNSARTDGQTNGGRSTSWAIRSWFGRLTYNYMDKYLLEGNLRYDGTSRLPSESRWGAFPSFSLGWRLSEEGFMKESKEWLSNVKIRASWGELGNQNIGEYPYQAILGFVGPYSFDNNSLTQGVAQQALNNRNLIWETTTTTDLGLDLTLFNKFTLGLDVYKKYTKDILRSAQTTGVVGLTAPTINGGEMQNVGFDLDLVYGTQIKSGPLEGMNFRSQFIMSSFKNKLVKFGTLEDGGSVLREEGRPWDTFYLLQVLGIFQSVEEIASSPSQYGANTQPGMLKFQDVNNDGVINNDDRVPMEKGVFPSATYSFNISVDWKGFDMFALFQGVAGQKTYINGWGFQPYVQGSPPTKKLFREAWTPENHSTTTVMIGDPISYGRESTYRLMDNSYLRLKALQLGFTIPSKVVQQIGLSNFRLYLSGDNLLTFTNYEGLDPEREGNGRFLAYPQNKVVSLGCNIKF